VLKKEDKINMEETIYFYHEKNIDNINDLKESRKKLYEKYYSNDNYFVDFLIFLNHENNFEKIKNEKDEIKGYLFEYEFEIKKEKYKLKEIFFVYQNISFIFQIEYFHLNQNVYQDLFNNLEIFKTSFDSFCFNLINNETMESSKNYFLLKNLKNKFNITLPCNNKTKITQPMNENIIYKFNDTSSSSVIFSTKTENEYSNDDIIKWLKSDDRIIKINSVDVVNVNGVDCVRMRYCRYDDLKTVDQMVTCFKNGLCLFFFSTLTDFGNLNVLKNWEVFQNSFNFF
jgi:hypothetical protein